MRRASPRYLKTFHLHLSLLCKTDLIQHKKRPDQVATEFWGYLFQIYQNNFKGTRNELS